MEESNLVTSQPVLVTGAGGYVAGHIIKILLEKGYTVRGSVRKADQESIDRKYPFLTSLEGADERLQFVEADLTHEESWIEACNGVEYVLHIASPYVLSVTDAQTDLVDPAVNGTLSVLRACLGNDQIKKVVLTSSMASVSDSFDSTKTYNEEDWNEESSLTRNPYYYSKKMAEESAHQFMEENNPHFSLGVINPFLVLGPHLGGQTHASATSTLLRAMNGEMPGILNLHWGITDVRDAALAHILVMESEEALGRFLVAQGPISAEDLYLMIGDNYPDYRHRLPTRHLPDFLVYTAAHFEPSGTKDYLNTNLGRVPHFSTNKFESTFPSFSYTPLDQTVIDQVGDLIDNGHVKDLSEDGTVCLIL